MPAATRPLLRLPRALRPAQRGAPALLPASYEPPARPRLPRRLSRDFNSSPVPFFSATPAPRVAATNPKFFTPNTVSRKDRAGAGDKLGQGHHQPHPRKGQSVPAEEQARVLSRTQKKVEKVLDWARVVVYDGVERAHGRLTPGEFGWPGFGWRGAVQPLGGAIVPAKHARPPRRPAGRLGRVVVGDVDGVVGRRVERGPGCGARFDASPARPRSPMGPEIYHRS